MFQTLATLGSLMLTAGAMGVIAQSLVEDRQALRAALRGVRRDDGLLPARTHRVASPRAARFIRMEATVPSHRAAA